MAQIQIVLANIQDYKEHAAQMLLQTAPCYVRKYRKVKPEKEALQELTAGFLLKKYLGVDQDGQLSAGKYGKPFLASKERFFNLSHSGDLVALAIAGCEVGIDVERRRPYRGAVAKRVFSSRQYAQLESLSGEAREQCFNRFWTRLEAMLKLSGEGFAKEWDKEKPPFFGCRLYGFSMGEYEICCACMEESEVQAQQDFYEEAPRRLSVDIRMSGFA